jgi:hypothetical protein
MTDRPYNVTLDATRHHAWDAPLVQLSGDTSYTDENPATHLKNTVRRLHPLRELSGFLGIVLPQ